tara:strand:+ start:511 stop:2070 length:1560 start_codon:yes stop_codon:yes gene_type:complete
MFILNSIKSFIKKNKKIIFEKKTTKNLLVVDRSLKDQVIRNSIISSVINKDFNLNVIMLTDKKFNDWTTLVYKSFGIKKFIRVFDFSISNFNLSILFMSCYYTILSVIKINKNGFLWFINKHEIQKIDIGDLIYDEYIRHDKSFLKPNAYDLKLIKILFKSFFRVIKISKIFDNNHIKIALVSSRNSAANSAITMRIAAKKKIPVIFNAHNYIRFIKNYKQTLRFPRFVTNKDIKEFNKKKNYLKSAKSNLFNRFKGFTKGDFAGVQDLKKAYFKKKIYSKKNIINHLDQDKNYKRIVLYAVHLFADAGHLAGKFLIFKDYYSQFEETLEYIKKLNDKNTLWVFKPHPSSSQYREDGIVERKIKKLNSKNIVLYPDEISLLSFLKASDLLITGRGNIGNEFACLGKKPLLAGEGYYTGLGVAFEPKNKQDYFRIIKNKKRAKLGPEKIKKAMKIMYIVDNIIPNTVKRGNIIPERNPKDYRISADKYFKLINNNLRNRSFLKDQYYLNLKKIIKKEIKK